MRFFSQGGQADDVPVFRLLVFLIEQPPAEIVFVPSGLNDHNGRVRFGARVESRVVPLFLLFADDLACRFFRVFDWVVNQSAIVHEYAISKEVAISFNLDVIDSLWRVA